MQAANSAVATVEQRHFLATAFNTHCASGPVIKVGETWVPPHVTLVCLRVSALVGVGLSSLVQAFTNLCARVLCVCARSRCVRVCARACTRVCVLALM